MEDCVAVAQDAGKRIAQNFPYGFITSEAAHVASGTGGRQGGALDVARPNRHRPGRAPDVGTLMVLKMPCDRVVRDPSVAVM